MTDKHPSSHATTTTHTPASRSSRNDVPEPYPPSTPSAPSPLEAIGNGLADLDEAIRKSGNPGPDGSGLMLLLGRCASQFLGVTPPIFPKPQPPQQPDEPSGTASHK